MIRTGLWWVIIFWVIGVNNMFAQPESMITDLDFFEGLIEYKFSHTGSSSAEFNQLNAIENMTLILKDGDFIIHLYGPPPPSPPPFDPENPKIELPKQVFNSTRLFLADSNQMYSLDMKNKRLYMSDSYEVQHKDTIIPTAIPTGDSLKILKWMCYGYKVKKNEEEITYYVTKKIKANMAFFPSQTKAKVNFLTEGLNGAIPLKTVRKHKNYTIYIQATSIKPQTLDKAEFDIPPGFRRFKYDHRR
jgi:hypothetical protein